MNPMMDYLVVIAAIFAISVASSSTKNGFSLSVFMTSLVIAIGIMIWQGLLPFYIIVFCALIMIAMLFTDTTEVSA